MYDCSLDSLKCNNTETYVDIHCKVLPSNKTTVTLREANGICREVHNNHLSDKSAKTEDLSAQPEETENHVGSEEVTTEEMPQTAPETMNTMEPVTNLLFNLTDDRSMNGKLKQFPFFVVTKMSALLSVGSFGCCDHRDRTRVHMPTKNVSAFETLNFVVYGPHFCL